jgi:hypothetical protein
VTTPHPSFPTTPPADGVRLAFDPGALRPLIVEVVREVLGQVEAARATVPDRLAFSEPEAARLLGLAYHQLRDERRRGKIAASQVVGRRIRYTRDDLVAYLAARPTGAGR